LDGLLRSAAGPEADTWVSEWAADPDRRTIPNAASCIGAPRRFRRDARGRARV